MKNKLKCIMGIVLSVMLVISINHLDVFAYNTWGYTLNGGVGNYGYNTRHYWVDTSASSYSTMIGNAVSSWVHTTSRLGITTPISIASTSTKSSSYTNHCRI